MGSIEERLDREILPAVLRPSRYTGNELNVIQKDHTAVDVRVALAFPDTYELGMSYLGFAILYHVLNRRTDVAAERVYAPWVDMEARMRQHAVPLFALESRKPLRDFDIVAFTLPYELCYTNILNMLDLSAIPLRSKERDRNDPLVIAGGMGAFSPEPLAEFVDAFVIGDGEEIVLEIVENMRRQENSDLGPDDLSTLWETRNTIMEEQQSIERTLQEIRTRKKEDSSDRSQSCAPTEANLQM